MTFTSNLEIIEYLCSLLILKKKIIIFECNLFSDAHFKLFMYSMHVSVCVGLIGLVSVT